MRSPSFMSISVPSVFPTAEGNSGPEAKLWRQPWCDPQHGTQGMVCNCPSVAEDIHEQRIRAVRAIEFHPTPGPHGQCFSRPGMDLGQTARPCRVCANVSIRSRMKIPVLAALAAPENGAWRFACGQLVHRSARDHDLLVSGA